MRQRVIGFHLKRAIKKRQRLRGPVRHRRIDVRKGAEHKVIGVEVIRSLALGPFDLGLAEARLDGSDHADGEFVLKGENVVQRAFVAVGPECRPVSASIS